ncbi:MAG TPA: hypothetical protein VFS42_01245 [Burkholderiaceae bacterium]|nr:hypothetical protein [Burkholderiaceae bacterium]
MSTSTRPPLKVWITCDVEFWPMSPGWPVSPLPSERMGPAGFASEIAFYRDGRTPQGCFGLDYQLEVLARHDLKGVFFVEPLASERVGADDLRAVVSSITTRGQEVGLHLHPEWLGDFSHPAWPRRHAPGMHALDRDQQSALIAHGLARLREAGAGDVHAFRAGGFLANLATLDALADHGLIFDSSLDAMYDASLPDLPNRTAMREPTRVGRITELPMSIFRTGDGRLRHAQICACSFGELRAALERAYTAGWGHFVILLHNRELMAGPRQPRPYRLYVRRFERLCAWLGRYRERFQTMHFRDLLGAHLDHDGAATSNANIAVPWHHTLRRYAEQALSRFV